jgi:putative membrane protein
MKQIISDHDRRRLDERVAETEKRTRTQIVLTLIRRSDSYAELPWKAFAMGSSVAGLILLVLYGGLNGWYPEVTALMMLVGILAFGALSALLTLMVPRFAKCFLPDYRAEMEVQQYAKSLFLDRELFATQNRSAVLVLVSLFERRVVILPDKGLDGRFQEEDIKNMIGVMTPFLKRKQIIQAFDAALDYLIRLPAITSQKSCDNELPDSIIEEEGI